MYFPDTYFQDEYRCDFLVPEMMKRAWAAELELLQLVIDICERHNLQYFAEFGTLLGAIRHHGFIPWDDDIDILLKRSDYNKLLQVLPQELPDGITLGGMYSPLKEFRDTTSSFQAQVATIPSYWSFPDFLKRFHGFPYRAIGIDIFPLDGLPKDPEILNFQKLVIKSIIALLRDWETFSPEESEKMLIDIEKLCNVKIPRDETIKVYLYRLADSISSMYSEDECDYIAFYPEIIRYDYIYYQKEWYDEAIYVPFETMEIAVPKHYHEVLSRVYGNYATPRKWTGCTHDYPFYGDQEKNLKAYLEQHGYYGSIDDFCKRYY